MNANDILAELKRAGIVLCREAEKLKISPTTFNDVCKLRTVSKPTQEHIAGLLSMTPQEVFGDMYRPHLSRPRKAIIKA